ncbi:unnamed protein product [Calypogeia fissa]
MAPARSSSSSSSSFTQPTAPSATTTTAGAAAEAEEGSEHSISPTTSTPTTTTAASLAVVAPAMGAIAKKVAAPTATPTAAPSTAAPTTAPSAAPGGAVTAAAVSSILSVSSTGLLPTTTNTTTTKTKAKMSSSSSTGSAGFQGKSSNNNNHVVVGNSSSSGMKSSSVGNSSSSGMDQQEQQQQHQQQQQQNMVSETFVRSLSGSRLSAEAPEFVPKGIVAPAAGGSGGFVIPGLISGRSLPIPGVLPVQFVVAEQQPFVSSPLTTSSSISPSYSSQLDSSSSSSIAAATSPPLVHVAGGSPPLAPELEEGFPHEFSPPQTHATAPAHAPHPKPVVTEELKAKIVKQVEFYFSDQNLPTDNYLMKFVKKDPDGFVPIPVVASFRKIKNLAKNHGVVAAALRNSTFLVVSEDGKKVRRAQPLPDVDLEEVQSRTVVAENLPEDHSIESIEQLFSSVGNVKMVRICQPEAANGANQTAAKFKSDMVVSNKLHALVEFEAVEQAEKAVVALTDKGNWRSGLRVRLLLRRTFQGKHGFQQAPFQKGRKAGGEDSGEEDEAGAEDKSWEESGQHHDRSEEAPGNDAIGLAIDRDGGKKGKGRGRGRGTAGRGKGQHGGPHPHHVGSNGSRNHQTGTSPQTSHNLISSEVVGRPPPGPRMPDGTRGFTLGRGKVPIVGLA